MLENVSHKVVNIKFRRERENGNNVRICFTFVVIVLLKITIFCRIISVNSHLAKFYCLLSLKFMIHHCNISFSLSLFTFFSRNDTMNNGFIDTMVDTSKIFPSTHVSWSLSNANMNNDLWVKLNDEYMIVSERLHNTWIDMFGLDEGFSFFQINFPS